MPAARRHSPIEIGLLWHSCRSENLGVGALSVANANLIGDAVTRAGRRPVFHLMGVRGAFDYAHEIRFENHFENVGYKALANPLSPLHKRMARCHAVFDIGGGDSFSDIYSSRRYGLIVGSKLAARLHGAPLVLSPQTIGPFHTRAARRAAVAAMHLATRVFARDEVSFALLEELGIGSWSAISTDVAFALPYDAPADKDGRDLAQGRIKVGINVSALLYRRALASGDRITLSVDYPALVHTLLERLAGDPRIELHLVPHVLAASTPYEDDYAVAEELQARVPGAILPPRFSGPSEAKSYIAQLDLFAGSRMHATIAALSSGTAVVPLGYSRKFSGLFDSLGYKWTADLTQEDNAAVLARFEAAFSNLAAVREEALKANGAAQRRLENYSGYLDEIVAGLVTDNA
ncbi:Polysaccharide pyruvyl transferase [Tsuneonella dongtanensis]|uniref:Polysaccharide pyruvyl transferase n=1 Tax=Tsuneonella dongtanensis TaxID=692370 RepID=A0A1B2AB77_9SPHN|nr:polysaccharide pyruvyl transferase family protein [Tsuneonella dongtanensis]ANY19417.1 Polysaccharide pyruvyl transferase [Tsuneonella dongtanensis]